MIVEVNQSNITDCANLAHKLWPDASYDELLQDFGQLLTDMNCLLLLHKNTDNSYDGFIQLSLRNDYVEDCLHKPVLYIEGIYVDETSRRAGIATQLILHGEKWGKDNGCLEIASDAEVTNQLSIDFHKTSGFTETNRIVTFKRDL